jgi:hypothetical protein
MLEDFRYGVSLPIRSRAKVPWSRETAHSVNFLGPP